MNEEKNKQRRVLAKFISFTNSFIVKNFYNFCMLGQSVTLSKNQEIRLENKKSKRYKSRDISPRKALEEESEAKTKSETPDLNKPHSPPSPKQDSNVKSSVVSKIAKPWHNLPFLTKRHYGGNKSPNDVSDEVDREEVMFDDVMKRSQTILFRTKSIFPFDFFPNELIIDITKVTVVSRDFFMSGYTQSIHIRDIMDVIVETGPFFSSLTMLDLGYLERNKLHIRYLKKRDAIRARQIIEGLIAGIKAGVDFTKIPRRELISRLPQILKIPTTVP